jgi:hypothetical protein
MSDVDYFELFAAEQVLKDYDLSYDELQDGVVGDGGDGGIDSLHVFINGDLLHEDTDLATFRGDIAIEVHITQAKRSAGFSEDAIHKLRASAADLLDLSKDLNSFAGAYNANVLAIVDKFREAHQRFAAKLPKLSLHYYFATLGDQVHPNTNRQVDGLKEVVEGLFSSADFTFDFVGARELLELARREPIRAHTITLAENPISVENSFICLVSIPAYFAFITENGRFRRGLFDANVRDYQGNVEVNRAIRKTLDFPEDEDFWWLNNGVTIIAREAHHSGKSLTIRDPQVVNGLQTSHEVFSALSSKQPNGDERNVLVRVIVPKSDDSYQRIVRATNSQTTVPPASLRATDPIHRDIEDYLRSQKLYYERRKNFYKNEGRSRDAIISIPYLSQAIMAVVLGQPNDARARPSTLIKNDADYERVFDAALPVEVYAVCVKLVKQVESYLKRRGLSSADVSNLRFHMAYFAARLALNRPEPTSAQLKGLDLGSLDDAFLDKCLTEVKAIYTNLGGSDQVAKGRQFVENLTKRITAATFRSRLTGDSGKGADQ